MSHGVQASELRTQLRRALLARLEGAGWTPVDEPDEQKFALVRLVRPLTDGFEATAEVDLVSTIPDRPPLQINNVLVGVAYEPLRRLWPLLGDRYCRTLLGTSAQSPPSSAPPLEVASGPDVPAVSETLAELILDRGVPFAERYASLDALLAALDEPEDPGWIDIRVPALLAAAGRFDEAAAALDRYHPPDAPGYFFRQDRRTAYQLRRWVSSHGDESLLPERPPPSRSFDESKDRSFAQARADAKARTEAVQEARNGGRGRDRDETRKLLQEALARRGLTESPLWLEATLDHLWDTPADRVRSSIQGLKALGRFGLGVVKAIQAHELPDISPPDWLEPPDPAFYEVPRADRWTMVSLAPGIDGWLEQVHEAARPRFFGVVTVDAWLKPESPGSGADEIGVHVGERRVGAIPEDAVAAYLPILRAAALREELPYLPGRLARRGEPPRYMLELGLPA